MTDPIAIAAEETLGYWRDRPRTQGAAVVLRHALNELARLVGPAQTRSLCYEIGTRLADEHPLFNAERLGDIEGAARRFLHAHDLGWLRLIEREDAVDFIHGCAPFRSWFGDEAASWSGGLLEGLYARWLRELGASPQLQLRQIEPEPDAGDILLYRFTHEDRFNA